MTAIWWLAVAVLVVGWMLWPTRRHAWPVVLVVGDESERVEGIVRWLSASGHRIALVGGYGGEVGEIISRLIGSDCPIIGQCRNIEQAVEACGGPAALILHLDGAWSVKELMRQV